MKNFLKKIFILGFILFAMFAIGLVLPATPKAKMSLLMSKFQKDSLLIHVKKPRIIFVAGSSMSLSLNSQVIKDSLHLNPINTGIHAGLGLFYMMDDVLEYIRPGDIIVLAPEYQQYYGDFAEGGEELLRAAFDTSSKGLLLKLRPQQLLKIYPYIPKYSMQKFVPGQYFWLKAEDFYSKDAFNQYGDAVMHWHVKYDKPVPIYKSLDGEFNYDVIRAIKKFDHDIKAKGARLLISFPPFQKSSFDYCRDDIHFIEKQIRSTGAEVITTPERFIMTDDLLFDTPYHLNKKGVDRRSQLMIEDLRKALK
jgi:hypothetical protein